jgi:hypothetical protein
MEFELYSKLYKCEDCKDIKNPNGVFYFINGRDFPSGANLPITIPVGHFGDVLNAKICGPIQCF